MFDKELIRKMSKDIIDSFHLRGFEVELTNVCNFKCVYCGSDVGNAADAKDLKILPFETVKRVVDEMKHPVWVGFSGGEPTLPFCLPNLLKSIEYAKEKGGCTELFTNGSAGLKTVEKLADAGLDVYHVSLPTLNPEKFTSLRLSDEKMLKHILEGVTFALESTRMSVTVETLAVKDLLNEIPDLYDYWSGLGIKTFEVQTPVPLGRMDEKLLPDTRQFIDVLKNLYERRTPRTTIKVNCLWFTCLHPEIMHILSEILFEECECGTHTLNIKADGKVTICPFAGFSVGDIRKQTLKEIYDSDFLRKYRATFNDDCYSCLLFKNCHGRCRLMSYMQDKDFSKKPYGLLKETYCSMKPNQTQRRDAE